MIEPANALAEMWFTSAIDDDNIDS
jgi:hypothetical protein